MKSDVDTISMSKQTDVTSFDDFFTLKLPYFVANAVIKMHGPRQRVGAKLSSPTEKFPPELDVDVETDAGMVVLNLRKTSMTDDGVPVLLWRDGRVKKYPVPTSQVRHSRSGQLNAV